MDELRERRNPPESPESVLERKRIRALKFAKELREGIARRNETLEKLRDDIREFPTKGYKTYRMIRKGERDEGKKREHGEGAEITMPPSNKPVQPSKPVQQDPEEIPDHEISELDDSPKGGDGVESSLRREVREAQEEADRNATPEQLRVREFLRKPPR